MSAETASDTTTRSSPNTQRLDTLAQPRHKVFACLFNPLPAAHSILSRRTGVNALVAESASRRLNRVKRFRECRDVIGYRSR